MSTYGHPDMGVYAEVLSRKGVICPGDVISHANCVQVYDRT